MTSRPTTRRLPFSGLPLDVYVLVAVSFCVALGFGIVAPALPLFATSFGVSVTAASSVISVFALVRLIASIPAGLLVNRVGEAVVLATGLMVVAVSSALAGLSTTFTQLLVLRGVGGFGSAMFTVSAMALLLRVVSPDQRGQAASAFQGGFLLGGVFGPALGGLVTSISIRLPFFLYAVTLGMATVVVVVRLIPHHRNARQTTPFESTPSTSAMKLGDALTKRAYVTALLVNLANGFTLFGLRTSLIPLFVVKSLGAEPAVTGYGLLVSAATQAVLLVPAGRITDHRGRKPALIFGSLVGTVGMATLAFATTDARFYLAMAILGVGTAFLGAAPAAIVGDITGGARGGGVVAAFQMTSDVGAIVGPIMAGLIVDNTGSYEYAFLVGAVAFAVAFAASLTMTETRRPVERVIPPTPVVEG